MGPVSDGGDYNYDNPMILGSERTGPDLSYIGRKRAQQWEIDHLKDPRQYSPLSLMPSFAFLSDSDLRAISEYLYYLGDRNAAEFMIESPAALPDRAKVRSIRRRFRRPIPTRPHRAGRRSSRPACTRASRSTCRIA